LTKVRIATSSLPLKQGVIRQFYALAFPNFCAICLRALLNKEHEGIENQTQLPCATNALRVLFPDEAARAGVE